MAALRQVVSRAASEHLDGGFEGDVRANELAAPYPAIDAGGAAKTGAIVVETLHPRGSEETTVHFAMVKQSNGYAPANGDWEYLVVDRTGAVLARGDLPLCARCHAEAPGDHVFGRTRAE